MRPGVWGLLAAGLAALALGSAPALAQPDPFVEGLTAHSQDQALLLDMVFARPGAEARLRERLASYPVPGELARRGWPMLCAASHHSGRYRQAVEDCSRAVMADPTGGDGNTLAIVRVLAGQRPTTAYGSARVPVSAGEHVQVIAGDYEDFAIADTGAQISVMMRSVAEAAHVHILGVSGSVGSTTASVVGQIGVVPEVRIGGAVLRDLPVLVLPDESLTLAEGQVRLPFILSLYAMADFGRVGWSDHGRWLLLGEAAPDPYPTAVPMLWHPFGLGLPLEGPGGRRVAHLDSGANISYLFRSGLPLLMRSETARLSASTRRIGGVGGMVEEKIETLPRATLRLAGQPLVLSDVDVARDTESGEAARIGEDVLNRYAAVVLDFRTMTFSVNP